MVRLDDQPDLLWKCHIGNKLGCNTKPSTGHTWVQARQAGVLEADSCIGNYSHAHSLTLTSRFLPRDTGRTRLPITSSAPGSSIEDTARRNGSDGMKMSLGTGREVQEVRELAGLSMG